jgi:hypothetical protein
MSFSDVVKPGTSALVESVRKRSTPSSPSRANSRVGDRVVDGDELEHERPEGDGLPLGDLVLRGLLEPVLAQLGAEQGEGQPGADERDVAALAQEVRRRADVVLVPVGQDQRLDGIEAVTDGVEVREDQVDTRVVVLREEHSAVDDQQPAVVLEDGHVATDLAQSAERDDPEASGSEGGGRAQVGMGMTQGFPRFVGTVWRGSGALDPRI